mgnify:FL=1
MKKLQGNNRKEFIDKMTENFQKITRDNIGDLEIIDSCGITLLEKLKELKSSLTLEERFYGKRLEKIEDKSSLIFGSEFKIPECLLNLNKLRNSEIKTNQLINLFNFVINFHYGSHDQSDLDKSIKEFFEIDGSTSFEDLDGLLNNLRELLLILGIESFEESDIVFKLLYLVNEERFVIHNYLIKNINQDIAIKNESKSFKMNSCLDLADFRITLSLNGRSFAEDKNLKNAIVFNCSKNYLQETLDLLYDQFKIGSDLFLSNLFNKIIKEKNGNCFKFVDFYFMKTSSQLCSDENLVAILKSSDISLSRLLSGSEGNHAEIVRLNRLALEAKK